MINEVDNSLLYYLIQRMRTREDTVCAGDNSDTPVSDIASMKLCLKLALFLEYSSSYYTQSIRDLNMA